MTLCSARNATCEFCVGFFQVVPEIFRDKIIPEKLGGYAYDIMQVICGKLELSCCYVELSHRNYGMRYNGTWDGLVRDISSGDIHSSLPLLTPTKLRREVTRSI